MQPLRVKDDISIHVSECPEVQCCSDGQQNFLLYIEPFGGRRITKFCIFLVFILLFLFLGPFLAWPFIHVCDGLLTSDINDFSLVNMRIGHVGELHPHDVIIWLL